MDNKKLESANRWFNKALKFESDGKSERVVDMALNKAAKLETEAVQA